MKFLIETYGGSIQGIHGPMTDTQADNHVESCYRALLKRDPETEMVPRFLILDAMEPPSKELLTRPEQRAGTESDRRGRAFTERRRDGKETPAPASEAPATDEGREIPETEKVTVWQSKGYTFNPETGEPLPDISEADRNRQHLRDLGYKYDPATGEAL